MSKGNRQVGASIRHGLASIGRRPGLAVLLYAVDAVIGLLLTIPAYAALRTTTASSGFVGDLMTEFDLVLWSEIWEGIDKTVLGLIGQLFWVVPVLLLWRAVSSVGIIHAAAGGFPRSFWSGVGLFGARSILLGLMSGVLLIAAVIGIVLVALVTGFILPDGTAVWIGVALCLFALVAVDLVTDYARIMLVEAGKPVTDAWISGIRWSVSRPGVWTLYAAWAIPALAVWLVPLVMRAAGTPGTIGAVMGVALVAQLAMLIRAAITVGWLSSEGDYYNQSRVAEAPLIAEGDWVSAETPAPRAGAMDAGFYA